MKKILLLFLFMFCGFAFATDYDTLTSKKYVDDEVIKLQNALTENTADTVMVYTEYPGTVDKKGIYDASSSYATQTDSLVTAATANTAIQNAIDSEFACYNYPDCTLFQISKPTANTVQQPYVSATGTGVQNGTPTPTNPIEPVFYRQGAMVLRKVGNYADSYDAATGKITRRVGVKVLNGTENWTWVGSSGWRARLNISTVETTTSSTPALLCNMFITSSWLGVSATTPLISINSTGTTINFTVGWNANITTLTDWTAFLADQYAAGTPVIVIYPLETPTEETWSAATYSSNLYVPQDGN